MGPWWHRWWPEKKLEPAGAFEMRGQFKRRAATNAFETRGQAYTEFFPSDDAERQRECALLCARKVDKPGCALCFFGRRGK